jgi:hypothetical protein
VPKWKLSQNRDFGLGTTYGHNGIDMLYHQFEIRKQEQHDSFIKKCKLVLEEL